jgi:hypothetical protein
MLTACFARDEEVFSHFGQEVNFHMIISPCRCAWWTWAINWSWSKSTRKKKAGYYVLGFLSVKITFLPAFRYLFSGIKSESYIREWCFPCTFVVKYKFYRCSFLETFCSSFSRKVTSDYCASFFFFFLFSEALSLYPFAFGKKAILFACLQKLFLYNVIDFSFLFFFKHLHT